MIYSHGNAEELSKSQIVEMAQFAAEIDCDVILYEYAGYGISQDSDGNYLQCVTPLLCIYPDDRVHCSHLVSEETCCESLAAVYEYATRAASGQGLGLIPEQIVIYGRSLGTGVSIELASNLTAPVAMVLYTMVVCDWLILGCSCFFGVLLSQYLQLSSQVNKSWVLPGLALVVHQLGIFDTLTSFLERALKCCCCQNKFDYFQSISKVNMVPHVS